MANRTDLENHLPALRDVTASFTPPTPVGSVCVAMVTPMHEDGSVDLDTASKLARHLVDQGCDSILVSGTTGEAPTTHQEEKDQLTRSVVDAVAGNAYVMAGAGSNDTAHAVRMARQAQACGANGLLVVSPYYNRPSQAGIIAHVRAIGEATSLPITLYDIPGRTGVAFSDETLDALAAQPNIVAVKDATGNSELGCRRLRRTGLAYYSGDDGLNYAFLVGGASGVISVVGHVAAAYYRELVDSVRAEDFVTARRIHLALTPLVDAIMGGGQGAVMAKVALHLQGVLPHPQVRLPLAGASEESVGHLRDVMAKLKLL